MKVCNKTTLIRNSSWKDRQEDYPMFAIQVYVLWIQDNLLCFLFRHQFVVGKPSYMFSSLFDLCTLYRSVTT